MSESRAIEVEGLAERADWVRALARSLAADPDSAEDLSQDVWVAALEHPKRPGVPLSRWLASIARNLSRTRWRGELRRLAREREAARPEGQGPEGELLERLEIHQRLVTAVRELAEPYRSAILLRYFERLAPAEIAARTGAPQRTVHTRLQRGLALLRGRLAREEGGARAWLALLLPLTRPEGALLGGLLVKTKLAAALAAAVLVGLVWWKVRAPAAAPAQPAALSQPAAALAAVADEPETPAELAAGPERAEVERSEPAQAPIATSVAAETVAGEVLDARGRPLAGVPVVFLPTDGGAEPALAATSDDLGRFEIARPARAGHFDVESESLVAVLRPRFFPTDSKTRAEFRSRLQEGAASYVIVVAPRAPLAGTVVDLEGRPLSGAEIQLVPPDGLRAGIERVLVACEQVDHVAKVDAQGRFALPQAYDVEGSELATALAGYARDRRSPPPGGDRAMLIELRPLEERATRIRGTVVDAEGVPVDNALVAMGHKVVRSGADGRFEFDLQLDPIRFYVDGDGKGPHSLRALKPGYLPALLPCRAATFDAPDAWPEEIVLELGGAPLHIAGRVVDADDRPVAGAVIDLLDPEPFGEVPRLLDGKTHEWRMDVETLLAEGTGAVDATSGEDGHFELIGLQPRSYRLRVLDRRRLEVVFPDPIEAGRDDVAIVLARGESLPLVAGRIVSKHGAPVAGAAVWLERRLPATNASEEGELVLGQWTHTDSEGRFELRDVASAAFGIRASVPNIPGFQRRELAAFADLTQIEFVVPVACHFRVDLTGSPIEAEYVGVLDADGNALDLFTVHGTLGSVGARERIEGGRTEAIAVVDTAVTLVLYKGSVEVGRRPLALVPGELTVVRP